MRVSIGSSELAEVALVTVFCQNQELLYREMSQLDLSLEDIQERGGADLDNIVCKSQPGYVRDRLYI